MKKSLGTIWLYLARRDKKAVRILCKGLGKDILASRVESLDKIGLPEDWHTKIKQVSHDNRMLWELWVESFERFEDLRAALHERGYSNIPMSPQPELSASMREVPNFNLQSIPNRKTMLQKRT